MDFRISWEGDLHVQNRKQTEEAADCPTSPLLAHSLLLLSSFQPTLRLDLDLDPTGTFILYIIWWSVFDSDINLMFKLSTIFGTDQIKTRD